MTSSNLWAMLMLYKGDQAHIQAPFFFNFFVVVLCIFLFSLCFLPSHYCFLPSHQYFLPSTIVSCFCTINSCMHVITFCLQIIASYLWLLLLAFNYWRLWSFFNEAKCEDEVMEETPKHLTLQTKKSRVL